MEKTNAIKIMLRKTHIRLKHLNEKSHSIGKESEKVVLLVYNLMTYNDFLNEKSTVTLYPLLPYLLITFVQCRK